jgi:hypothetical protein
VSARIKPHKVRGREFEEVREKDPDGRIVYHHRTVDTLGKMLRAGTIDQAMHDAAKDFQAAFIIANLDPLRALPILRVPGTGREPELSERQLDARRRVHQAMGALGGISSPAGSCVWHVVGLQRSVREWAMRQGWGGQVRGPEAGAGDPGGGVGDAGEPLGLSDGGVNCTPAAVGHITRTKASLFGQQGSGCVRLHRGSVEFGVAAYQAVGGSFEAACC